jgi:hypothetical protein
MASARYNRILLTGRVTRLRRSARLLDGTPAEMFTVDVHNPESGAFELETVGRSVEPLAVGALVFVAGELVLQRVQPRRGSSLVRAFIRAHSIHVYGAAEASDRHEDGRLERRARVEHLVSAHTRRLRSGKVVAVRSYRSGSKRADREISSL